MTGDANTETATTTTHTDTCPIELYEEICNDSQRRYVDDQQSNYLTTLKNQVNDPETVHRFFAAVYDRELPCKEPVLEHVLYRELWLNHSSPDREERVERWGMLGEDMVEFVPTAYRDIRSLLEYVDPDPGDVICDAGGGNGRVSLVGAMVTDSVTWRSVELVDELVTVARETAEQWRIEDVDIVHGNILDQSYDDVDTVYTCFPLTGEAGKEMESRLGDMDVEHVRESDISHLSR